MRHKRRTYYNTTRCALLSSHSMENTLRKKCLLFEKHTNCLLVGVKVPRFGRSFAPHPRFFYSTEGHVEISKKPTVSPNSSCFESMSYTVHSIHRVGPHRGRQADREAIGNVNCLFLFGKFDNANQRPEDFVCHTG